MTRRLHLDGVELRIEELLADRFVDADRKLWALSDVDDSWPRATGAKLDREPAMKRSTSNTCILPIALAVAASVPVPISELPLAAEEEPAPAAQEEAMAPAGAGVDERQSNE